MSDEVMKINEGDPCPRCGMKPVGNFLEELTIGRMDGKSMHHAMCFCGWRGYILRARNSIGGNAAEHTSRGFAVYGRVTDGRGNVVRVQRSSIVGEPHCYVFVNDSDGREFRVGVPGCDHGVAVVSPHLNADQARALAALLVAFADDADGVAK